ncbi:HYD1 signature containing ADP-ribosyltransferase family protein [Streptomyces sp. MJM1172]|uniref:HYD1 signature containing ADP-ribosyltransferase family protein n=1 Tax=Streptomyces sp. MJM1172 TaxID=1703926 RepID=UPI003FD2FF5D
MEQVPEGEVGTLYHYTNEAGYDGIIESEELRASIKAHNPKDARFGDGQYLSGTVPGTKRPGQLSHAFIRVPWGGGASPIASSATGRTKPWNTGKLNGFTNRKPIPLSSTVRSGRMGMRFERCTSTGTGAC